MTSNRNYVNSIIDKRKKFGLVGLSDNDSFVVAEQRSRYSPRPSIDYSQNSKQLLGHLSDSSHEIKMDLSDVESSIVSGQFRN